MKSKNDKIERHNRIISKLRNIPGRCEWERSGISVRVDGVGKAHSAEFSRRLREMLDEELVSRIEKINSKYPFKIASVTIKMVEDE